MNETSADEWWRRQRGRYNRGLIVSGVLAFVAYVVVGEVMSGRLGPDFEITLFTTLFQGVGYLFMMGVANLFYFLGPAWEKRVRPEDVHGFRDRLFRSGYWFSFGLPFTVPLLLLISAILSPVQ